MNVLKRINSLTKGQGLPFLGVILAFIFYLNGSSAHAQSSRGFSRDPETFTKELKKHLKDLVGKKESEEKLALFVPYFLDPEWELDPEQRDIFMEVANEMLRRRMVTPQSWVEWMELFQYWSWPAGNVEQGQSERFFAEMQREFKKSGRRDMETVLHTYAGLTQPPIDDQILLFSDGKVRWVYVGGVMELSPANAGDTATFLLKEGGLRGYRGMDSLEVQSTDIILNPISGKYRASGGKVEWLRAGFGPGELYAVFGNWDGDVKASEIEVDSVTLFTAYFTSSEVGEAVPVLSKGRFVDRLTGRTIAEKAMYPQFEAYSKQIQIDNFFEGVDYTGGFSILGQRFFASGTSEEKARFTFRLDTLTPLEIKSERFVIRSDELLGSSAEVIFRVGESDSIYHAYSEVRYDPFKQVVRINRPDEGLSRTPYSDSYHRIVLELDRIIWNVTEPSVYLGGINMGVGSPMVVESDQYYRPGRYAALQGLIRVNPLISVFDVGNEYGNKGISLYNMAVGLGISLERCELFMMDLAVQGFVHFDMKKQRIDVLPKTGEYIQDHRKERDYDVIRFVSEVPDGMNARLSLLNNDLEVVGIQNITLSDQQEVILFPEEQRVLIHKNLDFDFDGKVVAGRFSFFSRKNEFKYDAFKFNMPYIDSMRFYVQSFEPLSDGSYPLVRVRNTIQDISGELFIDFPTNKSSQLIYPQYPIFTSSAPAKVYYDKAYGGVYKRDNFYVNIAPFTIDSLDNTTTEGLVFDGQFVSAGIYPERKQAIRVQRDYSLGFTEETGEEGWMAYQGSGRTAGTLQLSMAGLRLNGDVYFEKSHGQSNRFVLFPDSVSGKGNYDLKALDGPPRGGGHPAASGGDVGMHWIPKSKTWWTQTGSTPMITYPERPVMATGILTYQPGSLTSNGTLAFNLSEVRSRSTSMHAKWIESPDAQFRVRASPEKNWAFQMDRTTAMVDFVQNKGHFELLQGEEVLDFPQNEYQAEMNLADWDISKKLISIQKGQQAMAMMSSTRESQEGLAYLARRAEFYLEPSLLEMYGVPHIDIADSRVIPDSGRVTVEEEAQMRPLKNAALVASRFGEFHRLEKAELRIRGRNVMFGGGDYQYKDEDGVVWPIPMAHLHVDSALHVVAQGELAPEDGFQLSPYFQYYGIVNMESDEPLLNVRGRIHIVTDCPALETDWILARTEIDPLDIVIELPDPDTTRPAQVVYNGIYLMQDSASPYAAFVRRNNLSIAVELIRANGILFYDHETGEYVVTTRERLMNPDAPDNYLVLDTKNCTVTGKGQLSLGAKMGRVSMQAYGHIEHDLYRNKLSATAAVMLDFPFQEDVWKGLAQDLGPGMGGGSTDWANEYLLEGLNRLFTPKERDRFYVSSTSDRLPKELRQSVYFDDVELIWDKNLRAFRSKDALGVGGIAGTAIHRYVDGVLELRKRRGGDEFSLYFNPNLEHYFFYKRNVLRFYSTEKSYVDAVLATDSKKRSLPAKDGKPYYTYLTTSRGNMKRFLDGLVEEEEEEGED